MTASPTQAPQLAVAATEPAPQSARTGGMQVTTRSGASEPVDVNKIVRAVQRCSVGLEEIDPMRVAVKTINGLYDGATTRELDQLAIRTAAELIGEEPEYSQLAARLLSAYTTDELALQGVRSFSDSIEHSHNHGLIGDATAAFVHANRDALDQAIDISYDQRIEYFGMRTVCDRYLLRHPSQRTPLESTQHFLLRVACGLSENVEEAIDFYRLMASMRYLPSSPTLFNSGTAHPQMSSCYLVDSPKDSIDSIYARYAQIAKLSKFAGGIGVAFSRIRSRGALIRGTNGASNGIVPFLRTLDASVAAVNQGGRRKGAACVYLEPWHPDIEEFLELRDSTGEDARRTHNLNLANWIPDEFMRRVRDGGQWTLIDPDIAPELADLWGEAFERRYAELERQGAGIRQVDARVLFGKMMRTLAQTGNGWMTFKDTANRTCNQVTDDPSGPVVHLSNLCTEILEVTSDEQTAVCNLGSVNLARHVNASKTDMAWDALRESVRVAVPFLDRVIDINFYPSEQAAASNPMWRPIGLGVMGLQDVFFELRLPFDSPAATALSARIAEEIYLTALEVSADLAERHGAHPSFSKTRAATGQLQPDLWDVSFTQTERAERLRERIRATGLRNSLLIAIAPTATIASIAGCYECIEPQVSNVFKRETLSGEFLQVNTYLVRELKQRGLWNEHTRNAIKAADGSIQQLPGIDDKARELYRTAWELPQRALIDAAAARGPFIDQSQSLNLFMASPSMGKMSSMYLYAWEAGVKTTYYLRSRPATRIAQTSTGIMTRAQVPAPAGAATAAGRTAAAAPATQLAAPVGNITINLENPEVCESCQ